MRVSGTRLRKGGAEGGLKEKKILFYIFDHSKLRIFAGVWVHRRFPTSVTGRDLRAAVNIVVLE